MLCKKEKMYRSESALSGGWLSERCYVVKAVMRVTIRNVFTKQHLIS
jgi:hypothetical protein